MEPIDSNGGEVTPAEEVAPKVYKSLTINEAENGYIVYTSTSGGLVGGLIGISSGSSLAAGRKPYIAKTGEEVADIVNRYLS